MTPPSDVEPRALCMFCGNPKATPADVERFDVGRWEAMRRNGMRQGRTDYEEARHVCWQDDSCTTARLSTAEKIADAETLCALLVEMRTRYDRLACEVAGVRSLWGNASGLFPSRISSIPEVKG